MNVSAYNRGRLIAHAGGIIEGRRYTNSREALELWRNYVSLLEFDVCWASDGLIVAHDGLEKNYGIEGRFTDLTVEEFRRKRYAGCFCPMSLYDLISKLPESSANVILDIKSNNTDTYCRSLRYISEYCREFDVHDKVIIQVYSTDDYYCALKFGMDNIILALWKNYYDVRTRRCKDCVNVCFSEGVRGFRALSMRSIYFWEEGNESGNDIIGYFFERSPMIFVHGQPPHIESNLLQRGFGLFSHNPRELLSLV